MILVDTSVWIDFFRQNNPVVEKVLSPLLEEGEVVALSAVFGELLQGARDEREMKTLLEFWSSLPKIDEAGLFIEAGKLSADHKLFSKGVGLLDGYILAACIKYKLDLWSLDKRLVAVYSGL